MKNVASLSYSQQLHDMVEWANRNDFTFQLWVNKDTKLSEGILKAVRNGLIDLQMFSWP